MKIIKVGIITCSLFLLPLTETPAAVVDLWLDGVECAGTSIGGNDFANAVVGNNTAAVWVGQRNHAARGVSLMVESTICLLPILLYRLRRLFLNRRAVCWWGEHC